MGKSGCIRAKWLYSDKVVVFGQSGCICAKIVVIWQSGCIWEKVVVIGQSGCIGAKLLYLGKWLYSGEVVVFG